MPMDEELDEDIDYVNEDLNLDDEDFEEKPKEVKEIKGLKELKEVNYAKFTNKQLIDKIKILYPTMKGINTKKKEELITILSKKEDVKNEEKPKEVKKEKVKITKTKEELKKELFAKYPNYKIKATATKEDIAKLLEKTPEEFEAEIQNKKKKGV